MKSKLDNAVNDQRGPRHSPYDTGAIEGGAVEKVQRAKLQAVRPLKLDPPLIRSAGRRIATSNEEIYNLIELP